MSVLLPLVITPLGLLLGVALLMGLSKVDTLLLECSKPVARGLMGYNTETYYD